MSLLWISAFVQGQVLDFEHDLSFRKKNHKATSPVEKKTFPRKFTKSSPASLRDDSGVLLRFGLDGGFAGDRLRLRLAFGLEFGLRLEPHARGVGDFAVVV